MLTYSLARQDQIPGMLLSALLFMSQVANVAGFFWERNQQKVPPASAPTAPC